MSALPPPPPITRPPRPVAPRPVFEAIPREMHERDLWLVWRYDWRDAPAEWSKVPYQPAAPRSKARPNDPRTASTFAQAVDTYNAGGFDGIGYLFTEDDPYEAIDCDSCRDPQTGVIAEWAWVWIRTLPGHWEVSPSQTGVKGIVRAQHPTWARRHKRRMDGAPPIGGKAAAVEAYSTGRYFTITGDVVPGTADLGSRCSDAQAGEDALCRWLDASATERTARRSARADERTGPERVGGAGSSSPIMSDAEVLTQARKANNAPKFSALYDHGEAGLYGGDKSSADFALLALLCFWTQDPQQIDRLFRGSALYRLAKWDEKHYATGESYGEHAIAQCVATTTAVYNPGRVDRSVGPTHAPADPPIAPAPAEPNAAVPSHPPADDAASASTAIPLDVQQHIAALERENAALRRTCAAWDALHDNRTLSLGAKAVLVWCIERAGYSLGAPLPPVVPLGHINEVAKDFSPLRKSTFDTKMQELAERGFVLRAERISEKTGRPYNTWALNGTAITAAWLTLATEQAPQSSAEELAAQAAEKERRRQERAEQQHREEQLKRKVAQYHRDEIAVAQALRAKDVEIDHLTEKTAELATELEGVILQLDDYRDRATAGLACRDCGIAVDPSMVRCGICQGVIPEIGITPTECMSPDFGESPLVFAPAAVDEEIVLAGLDHALAHVRALESERIALHAELDRVQQRARDLDRLNTLYAQRNGQLAIRLEGATGASPGRPPDWGEAPGHAVSA